ncbi:hypothetical protein [Nocardioides antri]|uniref:Uncharacterized protein n=1 Tax=Nocardioides antri TaxID=2607659 RepID=A0A5B1M854_9ACTN|nr:hypothetical protein [Nocardioides antri]KAA1427870.1 hypothetical protein F0U47_10645 [Nocardioides antri]
MERNNAQRDPGECVATESTSDPVVSDVEREVEARGWHVTSHWFAVGGQVIAAGLDVRSFTTSEPGALPVQSGEFAPWDTPGEITRRAVESIPIGTILREHKRRAWVTLAGRSEQVAETFPETATEWGELAGSMDTPQRRKSSREALYGRVAELYRQAERHRETAPAEYVRARLESDPRWAELPELHPSRDTEAKRVRVRKWIKRARDLQYLDPASSTPAAKRKEGK